MTDIPDDDSLPNNNNNNNTTTPPPPPPTTTTTTHETTNRDLTVISPTTTELGLVSPQRPFSVVSVGTESQQQDDHQNPPYNHSNTTTNNNKSNPSTTTSTNNKFLNPKSILNHTSSAVMHEPMLEGASVGDYDMKKSASMAAFVQEAMEDRFLLAERNRLLPLPEEGGGSRRVKSVAGALLGAATTSLLEGVYAIREDDFWRCFEKERISDWNWNPFLFTMWFFGVLIRYFILFPIRCIILTLGWIIFGGSMIILSWLPCLPKKLREKMLRQCISLMSSCFVLTWAGVVKYHGRVPKPVPATSTRPATNIVFVANHTSLIDVILLQQVKCFSLVGQAHKGVVNFLQTKVLASLQCVWFDRGEMRDRAAVSRKLTAHAKDPTRNPLLVFPEGTCVNNNYVLQFKKGVFELGVPIAPVCIKYTKLFVDPFWSSRDQSFVGHLIELMTSWCLIADVWFLEPVTRNDGESAEEFAKRVRDLIAAVGNMKPVDWDGYLKHFSASSRLVEERKAVYADAFHKILQDIQEAEEEAAGFGDEGDSQGSSGGFFVGGSPLNSTTSTPQKFTMPPPIIPNNMHRLSVGSGGSGVPLPASSSSYHHHNNNTNNHSRNNNNNTEQQYYEEYRVSRSNSLQQQQHQDTAAAQLRFRAAVGPAALSSRRGVVKVRAGSSNGGGE
jgi:glycerol-3-phosphate O-acyltransferase 3/4